MSSLFVARCQQSNYIVYAHLGVCDNPDVSALMGANENVQMCHRFGCVVCLGAVHFGTNVTGLVGGADGASDGVSDGARLGSDDGARLGTKDGCSVASILGAIVGDGVLPAVGTSVGA